MLNAESDAWGAQWWFTNILELANFFDRSFAKYTGLSEKV